MALGSVANAAPVAVMPFGLCTAFSESLEVAMLGVEYRDGTLERQRLADTSRRTFKLTQKLTGAAATALKTFWDARRGSLEPFYFYHLKEGTYDASGALTVGRYTVRFASDWSESWGMARAELSCSLIELV
jgi:hypothetical protein